MPDNHTSLTDISNPEATRHAEDDCIYIAHAKSEPIAVIGIGCRFPGGANGPEAFWQLLLEERNAASLIPEDRWALDEFYDPDPEAVGKCYTRVGHFLTDPSPAEFDAEFFKISPREAQVMDTQQRIILEVVWEALENAGIAPTSLHGSDTGVFIGCFDNHHLVDYDLRSNRDVEYYMATSIPQSITVGRISYFLNLHGPNFAMDTACSSSLVAVHQACQSLRTGECSLALAGGVNIIISPSVFISLAKARMLSPDGLSKAFDNAADGYGRGEGCGVIVLKRLQDALSDGDNILAIIQGTAINHDGRTTGITAPSRLAQQKVIEAALLNSGLSPMDLQYIEAHGTGTTVGDPIELNALANTFYKRDKDDPLRIGSVKTNIGHLEAAAGIAGVIKTILALNHEYLPRHLNVSDLNKQIQWDKVPIRVLTQGESWHKGTSRRIAGVSSFGFSGTNAHVILEGSELVNPKPAPPGNDRPMHLLTISAQSEKSLQISSNRYAVTMAEHPEYHLSDIAYTANTGRAHLQSRFAVVAKTTEEAITALGSFARGEMPQSGIRNGAKPPITPQVGFLFTGQGAQYPGMGQGLYDHLPSFRKMLQVCNDLLEPLIGNSLIDILYKTEAARKNHPINQTALTQPALFALEISLAHIINSWGIHPSAVMGHSLGESAAAYIAGVVDLENGLRMVAKRGALMQALPQNGMMVAVETDAQTVESFILTQAYENKISIAAYNGPQSVVFSGEQDSVEHIAQLLKEQNIRIVPLRVSHAFHSKLMTPMVAPFESFISNLSLRIPQIPLVSTVTGKLVTDEITFSDHWGQGIRQPVRFQQAINTMVNMGINTFIEIGPHPVLLGMGRNCVPEDSEFHWLPILRKGHDDWSTLLQTLGQLYCQGLDVDWQAFDADFKYMRRKVQLPTYPFQRRKYWVDELPPKFHDSTPRYSLDTEHPLLGRQLQLPDNQASYYETKLTPNKPSWIKGHQFFDQIILPAAAYLEMALAMASRHYHTQSVELHDIVLHKFLHIPEEGVIVQCVLHEESDAVSKFEIYSHPVEIAENQRLKWDLHASGLIKKLDRSTYIVSDNVDIASLFDDALPNTSNADLYYKFLKLQGLKTNRDFQMLNYINFHNREGKAQITLSPEAAEQDAYHLHPAFLDGGLLLAGSTLPLPPVLHNNIPVRVDKVRIYGQQPKSAWCLCHISDDKTENDGRNIVDITYYDDKGIPIVAIDGVEFKTMSEEVFQQTPHPKWRDWLYKIAWRKQALIVEPQPSAGDGRWLIFNDTQDVGQRLAQQLQATGQVCILVNKGERFVKINDSAFQLNPGNPIEFPYLMDALKPAGKRKLPIQGIVYLWSLDLNNPTAVKDILPDMLDNGTGSALILMQSLINDDQTSPVKLRLVTRGALSVVKHDNVLGYLQAPLWGLGRVINLEHPEFQCRMIDLDPESPSDEIDVLVKEIQWSGEDPEIAYRQGVRYIPKLADIDEPDFTDRDKGELTFPRTSTYQLQIGERGSLNHLYLAPMTRSLPGPNEIEIAVRATGLNFIDILDVMGLLPFERPLLGGECAGEITAIGEAVTRFKVGDRVVALAPGSFSRYALTSEQLTAALPENISYEHAAGIPIVYLTAYFALHHHAKLSAQDRVLIHTAAGGVGCAAVQLAQRAGAEIYATASPSKWDFLRNQGITHIMNSRTLDFSSEILQATNGQGVDVILNSLSGDSIPASLAALAPHGRFVEIGKRAIWSQSQVNKQRPDIEYTIYDLITHTLKSPDEVGNALRQLIKWIANDELGPPPTTPYPIQAAREAFRFMQQAQHVGKIVITQNELSHRLSPNPRTHQLKGTYLVAGGWGALGIEVASWLAFRGAQHIILTGRSAPDKKAAEIIKMIRNIGIHITLAQADVADYAAMAKIFEQIQADPLPLRGVFHIAGVLDDGIIKSLTREQLARVMKVKIQGAWNLHLLTQNQNLDFFVLFSSVASVLGSPGQANYAAANAFLDSLAHYRSMREKDSLSINWGAWSGGGMATRAGTEQILMTQGVQPISPLNGMQIFQHLVIGDYTQAVVFPVDWQQATQSRVNFTPLLTEFINQKMTNVNQPLILDEIRTAPSGIQRTILASHVREMLAEILHLPSSSPIDDRDSFADLGIDSLMTVELRNMLQRSLDCTLPTTLFINYPTLEALLTYLLERINIAEPDQFSMEIPLNLETVSDNLDTLTEEELARQLDQKVEQLEKYTNDAS